MIKIGSALIENAELLERERGIPKEVVMDSLREAMLAAYKRYAHLTDLTGYECRLLERTGEISIIQYRRVVEKLEEPQPAPEIDDDLPEEEGDTPSYTSDLGDTTDDETDLTVEESVPVEPAPPPEAKIALKEARALKADAQLGDLLEVEVTPAEFGRIAAQSAKQVITQRIREAEKYLVLREFEEKKGTVVTAIVQRIEGRNIIVSLGKGEAVMPPREQMPNEYYRVGNKLRVYVADVREHTGRVPQIVVSQAHPAMVREIFELEVPEIEDGLVEIKSLAREAGFRTKVAVASNDPSVDPQGACIGNRGSRIQAVVNELKNEKIDIIRWSPDLDTFIISALAPAKIVRVHLDAANRRALVIVPDDQLSLAIGREGQNVRLAAKLTDCRLDIKSLSQMEEYAASQADAAAQAPMAPLAETAHPEQDESPNDLPPQANPIMNDESDNDEAFSSLNAVTE